MIRIYHVTGTRGTRVIWLCEELELPYEIQKIDFSASYRESAEWRAMNPVGKVPAMQDGDVTMFESGAMVDFLLARYGEGRLQPAPGSPSHAACLQWSWFAEATFARPLGEIVNHRREFPGEREIPAVVEEMANRAALSADAVAAHMANRTYLVDDTFTAADIMMGYSLLLVDMLIPERMPPSLHPYWQRLCERPAFQIARAA